MVRWVLVWELLFRGWKYARDMPEEKEKRKKRDEARNRSLKRVEDRKVICMSLIIE